MSEPASEARAADRPPATIVRAKRTDLPFDPDVSEEALARVSARQPFRSVKNQGKLRKVLRFDARLLRHEPGEIIVREGDYGNSAYFVLRGSLRVIHNLPVAWLGRRPAERQGWLRSLRQLVRSAVTELRHLPIYGFAPEVRSTDAKFEDMTTEVILDPSKARATEQERDPRDVRMVLQDLPGVISAYAPQAIEEGEFFGEQGALGRIPRVATVVAETGCELVELRWQGLRDLMKAAPEIKAHLNELFREYGLRAFLETSDLLRDLRADKEAIEAIRDQTELRSYGELEWYGSYKELAAKGAAERLASEELIAGEGEYPNGVFVVRGGFARESRAVGNGHRTTRYLGAGHCFGLSEIAHNQRAKPGELVGFQHSLRALGSCDVLFVPTALVERHILPLADGLPPELRPQPIRRADPGAVPRALTEEEGQLQTDILEFLVEGRYTNGRQTMLIDLDRCTRCDACVDACATTHDNNPRFVRHGPQIGRHMITSACMHCADPVCMIGCPTGAIHRTAEGPVVINYETCIGCTTCAQNCPYDMIRMVEVRNHDGSYILNQATQEPIQKATKCDLCAEQAAAGPACQRACPHDALIRVDMSDLPALERWLDR